MRELHEHQAALRSRADALVRMADAARSQGAAIRAELRPSVIAFVRRLRDDGVPPEAMLVEVKAVLRDALPAELEPRDAQALVDDAVRWSIDAYYDAA